MMKVSLLQPSATSTPCPIATASAPMASAFATSAPLRIPPEPKGRVVRPEISRFPCRDLPYMPGSTTTPSRPDACVVASGRIAFHVDDRVGARDENIYAAQWLACAYPYRRFADPLAGNSARLGADADRYSFI